MAIARTLDVFVVDDMTVSRQLVVNALEELGIQRVRVENDGRTALDKLKAAPAHLVISDNNMPGLDGLGLLRELRSYAHTKGIGFILVSGSVTAPVLQEARALGAQQLPAQAHHAAEPARLDRGRGGEAPVTPSRPPVLRIVEGDVEVERPRRRVIATVVGSCVAACLWDPVRGAGGMNHFLLRRERDAQRRRPRRGPGAARRYGVHLMELLINRLMGMGADRAAAAGQGVRRRRAARAA